MPECDNCHAERNPLVHVQDMALLAKATPETTNLEAKWCFPCLLKAAVAQCGPLSAW